MKLLPILFACFFLTSCADLSLLFPSAQSDQAQLESDPASESNDQRMERASRQCLVAESNCNKGCIGVGAVGMLSILLGNQAGGAASQEQMQQCTTRCDQAKAACDQNVASQGQEKRPVPSSPTPSNPVVSSAQLPAPSRTASSNNTEHCIREIKQLQVQSQSWGLSPTETSQRLGNQQKNMFSRPPCSEHPEANAYIQGANNMLKQANNDNRYVHNPANEGNRCVQIVRAKSHPKCSGLFGEQCFLNQCTWPVWIIWPGGLQDIGIGNSWPLRNQDLGYWMACKKSPSGIANIKQTGPNSFICYD